MKYLLIFESLDLNPPKSTHQFSSYLSRVLPFEASNVSNVFEKKKITVSKLCDVIKSDSNPSTPQIFERFQSPHAPDYKLLAEHHADTSPNSITSYLSNTRDPKPILILQILQIAKPRHLGEKPLTGEKTHLATHYAHPPPWYLPLRVSIRFAQNHTFFSIERHPPSVSTYCAAITWQIHNFFSTVHNVITYSHTWGVLAH